MDLLMPGVDGKEATILLKNCVTTKKIPIVIVAASNEIESITRQIGANDFLPKPFTMEKLLAMVAKYA
jgi:CheY-like chemotaxis protein